jgi:serine/threonine protein kinase
MDTQAAPAPSDDERHTLEALQEALGADFELKQRLGRGSVATVYLAREKALGRLVAVKVLLPSRARDETARRRFEREAKAAASLSHPNVVQVLRFGRLPDETPYLVMRFVKGRTLEDRLAAEGPLPVDLAREILFGVASALAAAHAQGIVHRDVRPANVLWDEERNQALLADFGIAALLATSGEETTRLTKTGQMLGDPRYLSPEQLLDQDLTELADIYALGVLGYEIFTGQGPYEAKTNTQWITAHLSGTPRDLRQMRPDVDPALADLLKRCLNREPNHRPSAATIASILQGRKGGESGGTGGLSVEDELTWGEITRRRIPQLMGAAVASGATFVGFVAVIVELYGVDLLWLNLSFPLAGCGVAAATVVAWFHGERGRQQINVLEWILLSIIGVIWLTVSSWLVFGL